MNRKSFAVNVLRGLGIQPTRGGVKALVGWERAEGGHWKNTAKFNPLNTTLNLPGSGDTGSQGNISTYGNWNQGVEATVKTLKNGNYGGIIKALKQGDPGAVAKAIDASPWGTHGPLVYQTIADTKVGPGAIKPAGASPSKTYGSTADPLAAVAKQLQSSSDRKSLVTNYFQQSHQPDALINLAMGLKATKAIDPAAKTVPVVGATQAPGNSPITTPGSTPDKIRTLIERANKIDQKHYPYVWGGGHGVSGKPDRGTGRDPGIGFDCSGAVSAVLGVDPRVSGQFEQWGKPGPAKGGKGVTVYANGTHVLMEINGHFFGTSGSNPRGGAGWIPRSVLSSSYLANFTARHL